MRVESTSLENVKKITPPTIFNDHRGSYIELYNSALYREHGIDTEFVQDDISVSKKHVLRGIHGDPVTTKLITCLLGEIYLVIVNNNPETDQYRQWEAFTISEENHHQILVPPKFGVAHLVLSEKAIFHYKQSTYYSRDSQFTLKWNDPALGIHWPIDNPILSKRDQMQKERNNG